MDKRDAVLGAIWRAPGLIRDFEALCDAGGRFCGTESEAMARDMLRERLAEIPGIGRDEYVFDYEVWGRKTNRVTVLGANEKTLPCHALIWSKDTPPGGLEAEVIDLGRGHRADFESAAELIPGRIALVRQDYPFGADTVHRMVKYRWAREFGAAGYLLAYPAPGQLVATGYCALNIPEDIPAAGLAHEGAALLARRPDGAFARARIEIEGERRTEKSVNLIAEVPGKGPEWVSLTAHYDGHDLAESALDNATGAAAILQILRTLAPLVGECERGLRVSFYTTEEWGLMGSHRYVNDLTDAERRAIAVNVNLDTIAGSPNLACLTSGYVELEDWVRSVGAEIGQGFRIVRPPKRNSDHYNYARRGIPALRLVAGFDEPDCRVGLILTPADTRDKAPAAELKNGTMAAAAMVWRALNQPGPVAPHKTDEEAAELVAGLE
jgi:aminopeptidase YwaD